MFITTAKNYIIDLNVSAMEHRSGVKFYKLLLKTKMQLKNLLQSRIYKKDKTLPVGFLDRRIHFAVRNEVTTPLVLGVIALPVGPALTYSVSGPHIVSVFC